MPLDYNWLIQYITNGVEDVTEYLQSEYNALVAEYREDSATLGALREKRDVLENYKSYLESYRDTIDLPAGFESLASVLNDSRGRFITEITETLFTCYTIDSLYSYANLFGDCLTDLINAVGEDISDLNNDITTISFGLDDLGTDARTVVRVASYFWGFVGSC